MATALTLTLRGITVTLIDAGAPGGGCSSGNAGVIATSFVLPLSNIHTLVRVPRMLLDPLGPLSIRSSDLPSLAPWLFRYALNALPGAQLKSIEGLKAINARALVAWRELLLAAGASSLLSERGMLEVSPSLDLGAERSLRALARRLSDQQAAVELLDPLQAGELEPLLSGRIGAALFHGRVAHVSDPMAVNSALLSAFVERGGKMKQARVVSINPRVNGVTITTGDQCLGADRVVVCAGFWSADLLRPLGVRVPIAAERGYHFMMREVAHRPSRPISFHRESFLASPLGNGLRLAGTVELAKPTSLPSWRRADQLRELAGRYVDDWAAGQGERWMGCRPSFPDSLPAIGRLSRDNRVLYAFGHQHLGLTQAAVTGQAVAALLGSGDPPFPLNICSLERFSSGKR
ncbi:NAD(P)/FAD-dependent oxidoreductase [Sphingopyxis chilensis]|uniref:NAD(P)/FAD-dependent oxidoreductase n=1 Tax=Sphingopyxis chilensis TaxID=180400 RepID=UPI002DDCC765|nr:FAD-binding oxidoreductase [Sphingopyxis chilensis]